jgi:hypothetical protein
MKRYTQLVLTLATVMAITATLSHGLVGWLGMARAVVRFGANPQLGVDA